MKSSLFLRTCLAAWPLEISTNRFQFTFDIVAGHFNRTTEERCSQQIRIKIFLGDIFGMLMATCRQVIVRRI